jgi:hypothetical protein
LWRCWIYTASCWRPSTHVSCCCAGAATATMARADAYVGSVRPCTKQPNKNVQSVVSTRPRLCTAAEAFQGKLCGRQRACHAAALASPRRWQRQADVWLQLCKAALRGSAIAFNMHPSSRAALGLQSKLLAAVKARVMLLHWRRCNDGGKERAPGCTMFQLNVPPGPSCGVGP